MGALFYSRWICLFLLISHYVVGQDYRQRRQVPLNLNANPNSNVPRLQSQPNSFISMNNNPPFIAQNRNPQYGLVNENGAFLAASNNAMYGPANNQDARPMSPNNNVAALPSSNNVGRFGPTNNLVPLAQSNQNMNPQMMLANNLHAIASNQQSNQNIMMANEHLLAASQSQIDPSRSRGYYNNPPFQPNPFGEQKPAGWFGTNHMNWLSHQESELDKNKLAAAKYPAQNSAGAPPPPANPLPPKREDGGPGLLAKVAKQYATKGQKSFNFGPYETLQGRGAVCTNMENFDGFVYGRFPCPLPASTGMSQLDVFCCGPTNYQYCCNQQEFSQFQRGAGGNSLYMGDQTFPKRATYPTSTKKMLAIMLPMAGVVVLGGIVALVFIFYKKFRHEQYRIRKLPGTMRLQENYSILPQDALADRSIYEPDGHPQMNSQA